MRVKYVGFEYIEPEEIVYDDSFKVSIQSLISKYRPKSVSELQKALNDNGYYGRSRVFESYKDGFRTHECKVKVGMIWSNYSYTWPFLGVYSFKSETVERMKKLKPIDICMSDTLDNLYDSYGYSIREKGYARSISKKSEMSIRSFLDDTHVLSEEGFKLVTKLDLLEFKKNVVGL